MDLPTLWYLTIGTLLVAAGMTLWERQVHRHRAAELGLWAAGYATLATGCVIAMLRADLPGVSGWAGSNLTMLLGYLTIRHGVARLDRPADTLPSALILAGSAAAWGAFGQNHADLLWDHLTALPIAAIAGLTAGSLLRARASAPLRSRPVAAAVFAIHAAFYAFRAFLSPLLVAACGESVLPAIAKATMYEAVLFSMAMPMALLALVREEYQGRLLAESRTDFLTGLSNRNGFFESAAELLRSSRPEAPVSLLAFDLDHFKQINDQYGHMGGDSVLKLFAGTARDIAGSRGLIVRLGGEEFAVLLPGEGCKAARMTGEAIAARFTQRAMGGDGPGIRATVSVGVAEARAGQCDLAGLLAAADRALYRAKALGRNRIEIAAPRAAAA